MQEGKYLPLLQIAASAQPNVKKFQVLHYKKTNNPAAAARYPHTENGVSWPGATGYFDEYQNGVHCQAGLAEISEEGATSADIL